MSTSTPNLWTTGEARLLARLYPSPIPSKALYAAFPRHSRKSVQTFAARVLKIKRAQRDYRSPSIHMPRWASRITLEITGVRAERLQSISESDARAEGVTIADHHMRGYCAGSYRPPSIRAFHDLWDSLNAARGHGWDTNPWVWVVAFRRIES
nr:hypothetical protein [Burkholderia arboris]